MTDQPYMPGPPPYMGPTMQQLAQPETSPKRKRKVGKSPLLAAPYGKKSRRKKSQAAPSKPAKQVRRRKAPVKATPPSDQSPATTSPLGGWLGLTIDLFTDIPDQFHATVLDVLDTLYRPRQT